MTFLRFLGNLLLAILLFVLIIAVLFTGCAIVLSTAWENVGLEHGVAEGAWLRIEDLPIYYRTAGPEAAPQAVLVHGSGIEGSQTWNATIAALSKAGVRVIAIDLKGYGYSGRDATPTHTLDRQVALLGKALDDLQVKQATIVGHDWGGAVALQLASERPQLVKGLVLVAPVLAPQPPLWQRVARVPYLGRGAVWAISSGGPVWLFLRWREFHNKAAFTSAYMREISQPTHIKGTVDTLLAMAASPQMRVSSRAIAAVQVPVLIIVGREDAPIFLETSQALTKQISSARIVTVAGAGHYVHIEQGNQAHRQIADFCLATAR